MLAPGTKTAAIGIKLGEDGTDAAIASSMGFGPGRLLVSTLKPSPNFITYDKFHWLHGDGGVDRDGAMFLVHDEIESRWDELRSGDAIDLTPRWDELRDRLARLYDA